MSFAYRRDIDGLRALAILAVLLFHAGVPLFTGGFVGVDIFFVISGFLITGILSKNIENNNFSLVTFYERRIRRIFPALFGMLLATTIAAVLILLPLDLSTYGKSLISAALSYSNINFWQEGGYFNTSAITKPLLHTWSLAVEEQFYLFFPPILIVIYRYLKYPIIWIWLAFIGSLLLSIYGVRHSDQATFYLLPTRAWELLTGALIALKALPQLRSPRLANALGILGLAMAIIPVFVLNESSRFPGENALLPCIGAALIIYSSSAATKSWVARLLGFGPFVFIGLISYSLYLWHWPLLAFMHYALPQPLSIVARLAAVGGSFALAYLSWVWLETPFRKGHGTPFTASRTRIFTTALVLMAMAVGAGGLLMYSHGLPSRINPQVLVALQEANASSEALKPCLNPGEKPNFKAPSEACTFNAVNGKTNVVIWGDSHAAALTPALMAIPQAAGQGIRVLAMSGCYPLPGTDLSYNQQDYCRKFNAANLEYLLHGPEQTIVWTARWTNSVFAAHSGLSTSPGSQLTSEESLKLFTESFSTTLASLLATGKKVIVLDPIPEAPYDVPRYIALHYPANPQEAVRIPVSPNDIQMSQLISQLVANTPVIHVKPAESLCDDHGCIVFGANHMYYSDSNHLSKIGAESLGPLFKPSWAAPAE